MTAKKFSIAIEVTETESKYVAKGQLSSGMVKMVVGELELLKSRLLSDLEESYDNDKDVQRFDY